jgi:hypothetical protein
VSDAQDVEGADDMVESNMSRLIEETYRCLEVTRGGERWGAVAGSGSPAVPEETVVNVLRAIADSCSVTSSCTISGPSVGLLQKAFDTKPEELLGEANSHHSLISIDYRRDDEKKALELGQHLGMMA